jgi:hypothetical protein
LFSFLEERRTRKTLLSSLPLKEREQQNLSVSLPLKEIEKILGSPFALEGKGEQKRFSVPPSFTGKGSGG